MKFKDTLLYAVLRVPINEYNKNCTYVFILIIPFLITLMVIGVCIALLFNFACWISFSTKD